MTVNKSQGQTFERVDIYLPSPVFSYCQFYVAFSQAKSKENMRITNQNTERQGKLGAKSDKVFIISCFYRGIFTDQQFCCESYKDFPNIRNVLPPIDSEQMDVDLYSNINEKEYLCSDCGSYIYSAKT
jgi:hypothetical protein